MEDAVFPKTISLGEYEFKFLTELEVERDSNGNIITQTTEEIIGKNENPANYYKGTFCTINNYNTQDIANGFAGYYFLVTEDKKLLHGVSSSTKNIISNINNIVKPKISGLKNQDGNPTYSRLNILTCLMKLENHKVAVYVCKENDSIKKMITKELKESGYEIISYDLAKGKLIKDGTNTDKEIFNMHERYNMQQNRLKTYEEIVELLKFKKQIILQGAPGTGKTYTAKKVVEAMGCEYKIIQFHSSYTYEDFVRGIVSKTDDNGNIKYEVEDKILMNIIKEMQDKDGNYILIIDEINRANLSSVLGELLYALEYRDEPVICPYKRDKEDNGEITIPKNLYIIGTMNTADRSIGSIDYAIRRRFAFYTIKADEGLIEDEYSKKTFEYIKKEIIEKFISEEYNIDDIMIGHSYFIFNNEETDKDIDLKEKMNLSLKYNIIPLLEEYYKDGILIDKEDEKIMDKIKFDTIIKGIKYSEIEQ